MGYRDRGDRAGHVSCYYLKLFVNKPAGPVSPPVNSPNKGPRIQHKYPNKIYKIQRIPP